MKSIHGSPCNSVWGTFLRFCGGGESCISGRCARRSPPPSGLTSRRSGQQPRPTCSWTAYSRRRERELWPLCRIQRCFLCSACLRIDCLFLFIGRLCLEVGGHHGSRLSSRCSNRGTPRCRRLWVSNPSGTLGADGLMWLMNRYALQRGWRIV